MVKPQSPNFCLPNAEYLSAVPVSTGTLKALLFDLSGPDDPVLAFHEGRLPIIVDALDEGRLKSAETGFENFIMTVAELLLENRSVTNTPKIRELYT